MVEGNGGAKVAQAVLFFLSYFNYPSKNDARSEEGKVWRPGYMGVFVLSLHHLLLRFSACRCVGVLVLNL